MDPWHYWNDVLRSPRLILAPMVDQSELPWRMLSREYGCQAAYTPMFHAKSFATSKKYRLKNFSTCPHDRPLIVQFCANNADILLEAARHVENDCDDVDINLGCPQDIARRGHYGAFLQDEWELIDELVTRLRTNLRSDLGVSCKIRRYEDLTKTIDYARMLEKAGCTLIGLHGRTREQRGCKTGIANWDFIRSVKENVHIPVIANGNIQSLRDAEECLEYTKADAIMTAEGNLYNPALFHNVHPPAWKVARRYLHWVDKYPVSFAIVKSHIFKLFHRCLSVDENKEMQIKLGTSHSLEEIYQVLYLFEKRYTPQDEDMEDCELTMPIGYMPVPPYLCQPRYRYNNVITPVAAAGGGGREQESEEQPSETADEVCTADGVQKRIKLNVS